MLVFKRAISLFLSLAMVFAPSLALARNGTPSHKFQPQETKAFQKAWQARAAKSRTVASVSAAKPSSAKGGGPFPSQQAAIESVFKSLKIKGQHFTYTQIPGPKGTAKAQILRSKDLESIFVDEYNTGTASRWEVKKGDTTIIADRPYAGNFSHMEITQPRAKAILKIDLQLNPDLKTYRLASVKLDAYKVDHEIGAMCASDLSDPSKKNVAKLTNFLDALAKASSASTAETALACRLVHNQKLIFDKSCFQGEFATSTDDMARALAKVFGTRGTAKPPRMLQCVEALGFADQSASMQGTFMGIQETVRDEIMLNAGWTQEHLDKDTDCNARVSLPVWDGTKFGSAIDIDKFMVPLGRLIKCDSSLPTNEAGRSEKGVVTIGKPSAWMAKNRGSGSAVDGYAALFLHEFMHQTGLPEDPYEGLVANVQQCCADPNIKTDGDFKNNAACKSASAEAKNEIDERGNRTEMAMYYPGYSQIRDNVQERLQSSDPQHRNPSTNRFMGDWYDAIQADPKARLALDQMILCERQTPDDTKPCVDKAFGTLKGFNDAYMNKQCKAGVKSGAYVGINCSDFKNLFTTAMKNIKKNPVVIVDPGVSRQVPFDDRIPVTITGADLPIPRVSLEDIMASMPALPKLVASDDKTAKRAKNGNRVGGATARAQRAASANGADTTVVGGPQTTAELNLQTLADLQARNSSGNANTQPQTQGQTQTQYQPQSSGDQQDVQSPNGQTDRSTAGTSTSPRDVVTIGGTASLIDTPPVNPTNTQPSSDLTNGQSQNGGSSTTGLTGANSYVPSSTSAYVAPSRTQATGIRMGSNNVLAGGSAAPVTNNGYTQAAAGPVPQIGAAITTGATAIANGASTFANTGIALASAVSSQFENTAYAQVAAARTAPSRQVASVSGPSRSFASAGGGGARAVPSRRGSSPADAATGNDPAEPASKSAARGAQEESDLLDPAAAPQSKQQIEQRVAKDIEAFQGRTFKQQNDVLVGLVNLSPETLSRALARGESSPIIRTLRSNGWTMMPGRSGRIIRSPAGKCYAPHPQKVVIPLPKCE
jgi:hypothetical protein